VQSTAYLLPSEPVAARLKGDTGGVDPPPLSR
jgi:hypothetical protein